jgi:hypothetical protein
MITLDLVQFVAVAFAVCGLAVVIWEIAAKDPGSFWDIIDDTRRFAEPREESSGQDRADRAQQPDDAPAPRPADGGARTPRRAA